jgi:prepilin-type N-terminal cleavage/methylation domain-containing protein
MKIKARNRAGFTLIEVVAVLVLGGITLAFGSMLFVTSVGTFVDSKNAVEDSQKIQVAMNRLVKELTFAGEGTVVVTNGRTLQWISRHPDRFGEPATATWDGADGSSLKLFTTGLRGYELLDNVHAFEVSLTADTVTITLKSTRSDGVAHTMTIHPRYDF